MSFGRKQLETWLKTIDVTGPVIDAGGLNWPVKGRTKSWDVYEYKILDIKAGADLVADLNKEIYTNTDSVDNIFCLEVMQFLFNPFNALHTFFNLLNPDGNLYISFHFIYPAMKGTDYLRYTKEGVERLLQEAGFKIESITPMLAAEPDKLLAFWQSEQKTIKHPKEIGWLVHARRL